jgi:hypothetical protein
MAGRVTQQHLVPCEGLQEIRRLHAVLEERVEGVESWQRRTNGSVGEVRDELRQLRNEVTARLDANTTRTLAVIAVATGVVQVALKLAGV